MARVMVFGTFDLLHPGHINFLQQAKHYGDELIVVVAREETVIEVKGRAPVQSEVQRVAQLQSVDAVDRVILGRSGDKYAVIRKLRPQVICLGYDQMAFTDHLAELFPDIRIVRLSAFHPEQYKSSELREQLAVD